MRSQQPRTAIIALLLSVSFGWVLSGCAAQIDPMPLPTPKPTLTAGVQELPTARPTLRPDGTALQNRIFFDHTVEEYFNANGMGTADSLVSALAAAGFDVAAMEVTPEYTAIGLAADSMVVSVNVQGQCLIAQLFPDRWVSTIAPVLGTGRCLVGGTHPIG